MTKTITALTRQKRQKERVNVCLDGAYAFSLSWNVASTLKRGQCLSQTDIERLHSEDEVHRAYNHALRLLGYRPRSQAEITRKLCEKGYAVAAIDVAIERLRGKQYLDDEAFARYWLEKRERYRPRGTHALRHELRQKGIDNSIIDSVLSPLDEEALAWAAIERKLDRWHRLDETAFRKKVIGFLRQRGFGYETVRTVCQKAWEMAENSASQ